MSKFSQNYDKSAATLQTLQGAVPSDFAADGAFVAVKLFGDFGDGAVA